MIPLAPGTARFSGSPIVHHVFTAARSLAKIRHYPHFSRLGAGWSAAREMTGSVLAAALTERRNLLRMVTAPNDNDDALVRRTPRELPPALADTRSSRVLLQDKRGTLSHTRFYSFDTVVSPIRRRECFLSRGRKCVTGGSSRAIERHHDVAYSEEGTAIPLTDPRVLSTSNHCDEGGCNVRGRTRNEGDRSPAMRISAIRHRSAHTRMHA